MTKLQRKQFYKWMKRLKKYAKKQTGLPDKTINQLFKSENHVDDFLEKCSPKESADSEMSYWDE